VLRVRVEKTRAALEDPVARVLREGIVLRLSNGIVLIGKGGAETPIEDSAAPIVDEGGEPMGAVLVFRDATEQRRMQAERERAAYAEAEAAEVRRTAVEREELLAAARAASRAKDEFLAVLTHELRTPLAAMLGWVSILRRGTLPAERVPRALEAVERNTLLDMTRIVAGKVDIECAPVDLGAVVVAAVEDCRPAAQAKGVELTSSVERLPCEVAGDEKRLRQIVSNLLSNAIKFTPRGGRVAVALARREGEAVIAVADTGDGIAGDFLPCVFDQFTQADSSMTRKAAGLGLGLSIVKRLTELHGGRIEAESDGPGKGATFTVHLPLRAAQPVEDERVREPVSSVIARAQLAGMQVLLVDDDPDARDVLAVALERDGARVHACGSVAEALRIVDSVALDAVVSDVGMPNEDGYSFAQKLRQRCTFRAPALALTGFASPADRAAATRAGFDDYLAKPVSPSAVVAKIREMIRSRRGSIPAARPS
jgi:signal transduction histidine kinase/CheY-like chemotaxis protein